MESVTRCSEKLGALQHATADLPHLTRQPEEMHISYVEDDSIENRDLFGSLVADALRAEAGVFDEDWDESAENPFAVFLTESICAVCPSSRHVTWYPGSAPLYEVCRDEAAEIVGGDEEATIAILKGNAALHEMPKEIRDGPPDERAAWARNEANKNSFKPKEIRDGSDERAAWARAVSKKRVKL